MSVMPYSELRPGDKVLVAQRVVSVEWAGVPPAAPEVRITLQAVSGLIGHPQTAIEVVERPGEDGAVPE